MPAFFLPIPKGLLRFGVAYHWGRGGFEILQNGNMEEG